MNPLRNPFLDQGVRADSTSSSFSLDSQPAWPYHLNHKQVLTVAFPSNLILPYIALAKAGGLFQIQADGVEWGPRGPVLSKSGHLEAPSSVTLELDPAHPPLPKSADAPSHVA